VRRFWTLYLEERHSRRLREEDKTVNELHPKKKGSKLLLGNNLDKQVQEYILKLRNHGSPVDTTVVKGTG